jgi:hypothetical protein
MIFETFRFLGQAKPSNVVQTNWSRPPEQEFWWLICLPHGRRDFAPNHKSDAFVYRILEAAIEHDAKYRRLDGLLMIGSENKLQILEWDGVQNHDCVILTDPELYHKSNVEVDKLSWVSNRTFSLPSKLLLHLPFCGCYWSVKLRKSQAWTACSHQSRCRSDQRAQTVSDSVSQHALRIAQMIKVEMVRDT